MKTLLMIKPDIVENGLHGEIIAFVLRNRFRITDLRMVSMDKAMAERFYEVHKNKDFFAPLVEYVTSGPVVAMEIDGENVITKIRSLVGATDPVEAKPGTIRHMYGISIRNNAVHASDSPEAAKKELAIVFGDS
ncbi:MAG: nucleoside-diphosphate kinase [Candidatus Latescibacterota bacterium]|nr:MAG: nucleoside-diphosphate kinase [Candidatus Latescibacterota bacterium]